MSNFESLGPEELKAQLKEFELRLADAQDERTMLGMQSGAHIKVSEIERIDRDIERYSEKIGEIKGLIEKKK